MALEWVGKTVYCCYDVLPSEPYHRMDRLYVFLSMSKNSSRRDFTQLLRGRHSLKYLPGCRHIWDYLKFYFDETSKWRRGQVYHLNPQSESRWKVATCFFCHLFFFSKQNLLCDDLPKEEEVDVQTCLAGEWFAMSHATNDIRTWVCVSC